MVYNSRPRWFSSFWLFPGRCLCCGSNSPNNQDVCPFCKANLPWQEHCCPRCALPLSTESHAPCGECQQNPPYFQQVLAPFRYAAPIDRLINDFKHHDHQANGRILAELFCHWLEQQLKQNTISKPDFLLPVPLHWIRLIRRGFNQTHWLAKDIGRHFDIEVISHGLHRRQSNLAQQKLARRQRQINLQDAFRINKKYLSLLKEKHIAIIDDVMTTGSTANTIARLLIENGITEVSIWTIARTPK